VTYFGTSLSTKLEGEKKTMKIYSQDNWQFGICDCYFPNKITEFLPAQCISSVLCRDA
jgi:hypothetical protein